MDIIDSKHYLCYPALKWGGILIAKSDLTSFKRLAKGNKPEYKYRHSLSRRFVFTIIHNLFDTAS
jgi:hypothetical protein